jgi:acyl-CoA thioesterase 8
MAGDAKIPIIYHVEHVREGRSYAVRTVQARQRGRVIFTTTMSFVKENSGGKQQIEHAYDMPIVPGPIDDPSLDVARYSQGRHSPFVSQQIDIFNNDSPKPHTKRTRQWIKVKDTISDAGGHEAHLAALAYMSDSYFIGTISRVHKLWRIPRQMPREQKDRVHGEKGEANESAERLKKEDIVEDEDVIAALRETVVGKRKIRPQVGMMVSLDHTIYFHDPKALRADDWLLTECETPWAGDGRGLVMQRIWTRSGKLDASCVQEVSL